jgi:tetratricopeptide (TPR) repeat protein
MGKKKRKAKNVSKQQSQHTNVIQQDKKEGVIAGLFHNKFLVALFLFIFSLAVFIPSLSSDFVWDDESILNNIYSYDTSKIESHLLSPTQIHYRPMLVSSFTFDHKIWKDSAFGFHLSNLVMNSIVTVLFYFLALFVLGEFRIDRRESVAILSSMLFAAFPMHVEAVSFVAGRSDLLCCVFFLLAFVFHILSFRKLWFLGFTALCFALSLLSKEVAIVFPIVVISYDIFIRRIAIRTNLLRYFVYAFLFFVYIYIRSDTFKNMIADFSLLGSTNAYSRELYNTLANVGLFQISDGKADVNFLQPIFFKIKIALISYIFYIKKLVFPFDLNPFITNVPGEGIYLFSSIILLLLLCAMSVFSVRKREGVTAFGISWILITLVPPILVALFGIAAAPFAERFLYIPSVGYCLLIGYWILEVERRINAKKLAWAFGIALGISYLFFTIDGQSIWKNNLNVWAKATQKSPFSGTSYINYGHALRLEGRVDEEIQAYLKVFDPRVVASRGRLAFAANNLGVAYLSKGEYDRAEKWFHKFYSLDSKREDLYYYHMGYLNFLRGERELKRNRYSVEYYEEAERYLNKLFENYKTDGKAHVLFANVYIRLGNKAKAAELARKALQMRLDPQLKNQAQAIIRRTTN